MTFGPPGEAELSAWMSDHARVYWVECSAPWRSETLVIGQCDLPLNLDQNRGHPFHSQLSLARAAARAKARDLPILI